MWESDKKTFFFLYPFCILRGRRTVGWNFLVCCFPELSSTSWCVSAHRSAGVFLAAERSQEELHAAMRRSFAVVNSSVSEGMSAAILEVCALNSEILLLLRYLFFWFYLLLLQRNRTHTKKTHQPLLFLLTTITTFYTCHMYF